jgi:hypothetical protein
MSAATQWTVTVREKGSWALLLCEARTTTDPDLSSAAHNLKREVEVSYPGHVVSVFRVHAKEAAR